METSPEIRVLFWLVLASLVAIVAVLVALFRSGRTVPPFAASADRRREKRREKPGRAFLPARTGRP
ncbi:hypothetical protein [Anaeromyxobacter sp. Fw109-5]|uniref:hypothetical protein n=1 Tax=Anaeromyxobacter sp. (strain Fw109-5) TaxID=404589 RepID=UPI00059D05C5|nr:hypothetical protein [Anaeromyxobacter sp. Fw109-5]